MFSIMDILAKLLPSVFDGPVTKPWLKNASEEELTKEREECRKEAVYNGDAEADRLMRIIDEELYIREHKNDPPQPKRDYRWTDENRWEK